MSGRLSSFGNSGRVWNDVRGLTVRAYCRITGNNPGTDGFDRSFNVQSISVTSTELTINFNEMVFSPYSLATNYSWSTGGTYYVLLAGSATGNKSSFGIGYRGIYNSGMTHTSSGTLSGAEVIILGGIGV